MKVFLAGATGVVGRRLVPMLVEAGHSVVGTTTDAGRADLLRSLGAEPAVVDGLDRDGVAEAVRKAEPEAVVNQMTALAGMGTNMRKMDRYFAVTNRLRTEGTAHLLEAARAVGARRFITQSYNSWNNIREGGPVKTEADPLDPDPPRHLRETARAIQQQEKMVGAADGLETVVLRYGSFYGPGTSVSTDESGYILDAIRKGRFPIVGQGTGVWSWLHIDDAALSCLVAVDSRATGIFNIADDEPAPVSEWLPYLCEAIGARPPRRVPLWLGRLAGGPVLVAMMESIRGADNGKARRELGWIPRWPTWRQGFRSGLGD